MLKEEITILIVDDDATFGEALREFFSRSGFKAIHVTKPDDALSTLRLQSIHTFVIDCMLPKMNGRELAKKIRAETTEDIPIFLMSGIFRDKNFAREAIQESKATDFLFKPFDAEKLVKAIEEQLDHFIEVPMAPLYELLSRNEISRKDRIKAINSTGDIHGFDLPWVFSLLMHDKISGHLNIINADGGLCGVGFHQGKIVQVNQTDSKSYFGVLMVEYGFISQSDLDAAIAASGRTKKLGVHLVDSNLLSPHAIQIVMAEQQGIRLSSTISDTSVKVNFLESDELRQDAVIDRNAYVGLLNDWLMSKFTTEWLKDFYMPWMRYNVKVGQEYSATHRCLNIPVVRREPTLIQLLQESNTLEEALLKFEGPEDHFYRTLHGLMICRLLRFGEAKTNVDYTAQRKRLEKLNIDLEKQTLFERLGLNPKSKDSEIKRAFHDVAKILHPDKMGPAVPPDVKDLAKTAFDKIKEAYDTLINPERKSIYLQEIEKGRAESILQADHLSETARGLLSKGDVRKARELLEQAIKLAPPSSNTRLLHMWAKLKSLGPSKNIPLLNGIRDELGQIPPEDRHQSLYFFVKGLLLKATGEHENAKKSFEHTVSLSPDFIDARRELNLISFKTTNKPVDILRGDLKDVVGLLFKKKK